MVISYLLTKEYIVFCTKKVYLKKIITFAIIGAVVLLYGLFFLLVGLFDDKDALDYAIPIVVSSIGSIIYTSIFFTLKYKRIVKSLNFSSNECVLNFKQNVVEFQAHQHYWFSYEKIKNVFCNEKYCVIFVDNYFIPIPKDVINNDFLNILKKNNIRNNIKF